MQATLFPITPEARNGVPPLTPEIAGAAPAAVESEEVTAADQAEFAAWSAEATLEHLGMKPNRDDYDYFVERCERLEAALAEQQRENLALHSQIRELCRKLHVAVDRQRDLRAALNDAGIALMNGAIVLKRHEINGAAKSIEAAALAAVDVLENV